MVEEMNKQEQEKYWWNEALSGVDKIIVEGIWEGWEIPKIREKIKDLKKQ